MEASKPIVMNFHSGGPVPGRVLCRRLAQRGTMHRERTRASTGDHAHADSGTTFSSSPGVVQVHDEG